MGTVDINKPDLRQYPEYAKACRRLLILPALYFAFAIVSVISYKIGGCIGALDAGMLCQHGSAWGQMVRWLEVSAIFLPFVSFVYGLFAFSYLGFLRWKIKKRNAQAVNSTSMS